MNEVIIDGQDRAAVARLLDALTVAGTLSPTLTWEEDMDGGIRLHFADAKQAERFRAKWPGWAATTLQIRHLPHVVAVIQSGVENFYGLHVKIRDEECPPSVPLFRQLGMWYPFRLEVYSPTGQVVKLLEVVWGFRLDQRQFPEATMKGDSRRSDFSNLSNLPNHDSELRRLSVDDAVSEFVFQIRGEGEELRVPLRALLKKRGYPKVTIR